MKTNRSYISHQKAYALTRHRFGMLKRGFMIPVMIWGNKNFVGGWHNVGHDGMHYYLDPA